MKNCSGGNPKMQAIRLRKSLKFSLLLLPLFFLFLSSCDKDELFSEEELEALSMQSPAMVLTWNQAIEDLYTFPVGSGYSPPLIARVVAMYHLAMHDALNCITPRYQTYVGVPRDKKANADAAVAQAVYEMLVALKLPNQNLDGMTALHQSSLNSIPDGDAKTRGIALGHAVTEAILAQRSGDAPYLNLNYAPLPPQGTNPGEYRYLGPLQYALAGYHLLTPFFLTNQDQFLPEAPFAVNSSSYTADYNEVKSFGPLTGSSRTPDQSEIGVFFAENSSRGWNTVAREVIDSRPPNSLNAWNAARLLALMHVAIADSYISVFDSKFHYYYWRPISAIRLGDTDGNDNTVGDQTWTPVLSTPPIGEYPSAHAISGSAAGGILIRFFGTDNYDLDLDSGYVPGVIRHYDKISDAVLHNSVSRIYIGYHFRKAVEVGEASGYELADYIFENALQEN